MNIFDKTITAGIVGFAVSVGILIAANTGNDKPDIGSLDQAVTFCVEGSTDPDRIIDCYEAVYGGHHRRAELSQQELDAVTIKCHAQTGRQFECIDAVY
jgi:hypothetical protein